MPAASTWPANLASGGRSNMSSSTPTTQITAAATSTARESCCTVAWLAEERQLPGQQDRRGDPGEHGHAAEVGHLDGVHVPVADLGQRADSRTRAAGTTPLARNVTAAATSRTSRYSRTQPGVRRVVRLRRVGARHRVVRSSIGRLAGRGSGSGLGVLGLVGPSAPSPCHSAPCPGRPCLRLVLGRRSLRRASAGSSRARRVGVELDPAAVSRSTSRSGRRGAAPRPSSRRVKSTMVDGAAVSPPGRGCPPSR